MAYQTKVFLAIVASMVNRMRSITALISDYNVGSVARTLVEAPAQEIDELYQQMTYGLIEAIQTAVYTSFNFPPLPAIPASNLIRVIIAVQSTPVLVSANTPFTTLDGSLTYNATADTTIPAGASYGDVPVACTVTGTIGNVIALTGFTIGITVAGFVSASNLSAFVNGANPETPSAQKVRFNAYVQTLSRGTVAALYYALTRLTFVTDTQGNVIERVATANIDEPWKSDPTQPPGLINAYIDNGVGGTSAALVQQAYNILDGYVDKSGTPIAGYVAAGPQLNIYAAQEIPLNVVGMLTIGPTYDPASVVAEVTAVLFTYIQNISVGGAYLPAVANSLVMQVPGVWNWVPVYPSLYVNVSINAKLMPGTFQILGWLSADTTVTTQTSGVLA